MARRDADYWRERGKVLFRALRDDYGARGATARDLMPLIGATDTSGVFMTLNWLRSQGVRVVCARSRSDVPGVWSPSRWALRASLPPAWDAVIPDDGTMSEAISGTVIGEVVYPTPQDAGEA